MNAQVSLRATDHPDLIRLNAIIEKATAAQFSASKGRLFESYAGRDLMKAIYALTECDGEIHNCRNLIADIEHDLRIDDEGFPLDDQGERKVA